MNNQRPSWQQTAKEFAVVLGLLAFVLFVLTIVAFVVFVGGLPRGP